MKVIKLSTYEENMKKLAEVYLQCGRFNLTVAGILVAMEGDRCRYGEFPEEILPEIPQAELESTSIGGESCADMDINIVRYFRGDNWNKEMLQYTADKINER